MAGFAVNTTGLAGLAAQLRRAQDDLNKTVEHLNKADFSAFGGLLAPVASTAREVGTQQVGSVVQAANLCGGNADAISQAAAYYGRTDGHRAAVFDAQQAGVAMPNPACEQPTHRPYTDTRHPQGRLTEPPDYTDEMSWKPSLESDLGKVGQAVIWVIKEVFGYDLLDALGQWLLSDWNEIRRIADRFNNASWACGDVATNIRAAITDAEHDWSGNAASQVLSWLDDLAKALDSAQEQNEYLAESYQELAEGFFDLFTALVGLVSDWLNKLLVAAASSAVAGAAEAIPVLDVFLDVNAAKKIWDAVQDGYEVYYRVNKMKDLAEAFTAAIGIGTGAFRDLLASASPMPNAPWETVPYPA